MVNANARTLGDAKPANHKIWESCTELSTSILSDPTAIWSDFHLGGTPLRERRAISSRLQTAKARLMFCAATGPAKLNLQLKPWYRQPQPPLQIRRCKAM